MKKLATLLLAAAMLIGSMTGAEAIEFKGRGEFLQDFGYSEGLTFMKRNRDPNSKKPYGNTGESDNFEAMQRVRLGLSIIASEHLMGHVMFQIGEFAWGKNASGAGSKRKEQGAYGQRAVNMGVRYAYFDWFVPNTDLRLRMGVQNFRLPSYTFAYSAVVNMESPGIAASYKINDNVTISAFWARMMNDNAGTNTDSNATLFTNANGSMDNMDTFGLVVPVRFDGFKVTPYGMITAMGPRTWEGYASSNYEKNTGKTMALMFPRYWATNGGNDDQAGSDKAWRRALTGYATAWWAGITGEITAADPFRFAWEASYGSVSHPNRSFLDRSGFFINAMIEYKLDWGVPGLYGWYASGDDNNPNNGSERMPTLAHTGGDYPISNFGFKGSETQTETDGFAFGRDPTGTWGIGLRLRDFSFIEDLKHTFLINLMGGTNSTTMARYLMGKKDPNRENFASFNNGREDYFGSINDSGKETYNTFDDFNSFDTLYLTTRDYAVEVNLNSVWKIYKNLEMHFELGYIHLMLDQSRNVWGGGVSAISKPDGLGKGSGRSIRGASVTDAWKIGATLIYEF